MSLCVVDGLHCRCQPPEVPCDGVVKLNAEIERMKGEIALQELAAPQAAAYAEKNPLGGPARMFDAIADRIRAGEPMTEVLEDFNLKFEQQAAGEKK